MMPIRSLRHGALIALFLLSSGRFGRAQQVLVASGVGNGLGFDAPADTALTPDVTLPQFFAVISGVTDAPNLPFELSYAWVVGGNAVPNFLTITPTRGVTPAKVTVALNPNVVPYLKPGVYSTTVSFSSTDPAHPGGTGFSVGLSLNGQIQNSISGVVNSASQLPAFAPGEIISIYGRYLGTQPVSATTYYSTGFGNLTLYPTALGGSAVSIGGYAAPLLYVSPSQINAVVPYELLGLPGTLGVTADVIVTHNEVVSAPFTIPMTQTAPGIFTAGANGHGQGTISNVDPQSGATTLNSANNPAPKGSAIVLYATGGGELTQSSSNGQILTDVLDPPYFQPSAAVSLTIGGQPAQVLYAGAAPGQVSGLLQINAVVPTGIASGAQPVVLTIGGNSSQPGVTVAVQ